MKPVLATIVVPQSPEVVFDRAITRKSNAKSPRRLAEQLDSQSESQQGEEKS